MPELPQPPTGTVTVLSAAIEGNPALWERDPAAMQAAHSRLEDILYGAVEANGGYAYQTVGHAAQATFPTASQAAQAAIDAQLLIFTEQWPSSIGDLNVRMALHSGVIGEGEDISGGRGGHSGYSGPLLNRLAGLLSAGHGGQVLLSAATQELVRDHLSQLQPTGTPGVQLLDMGEHHLKDLTRPERIFQLAVPGLPARFPPLHTLDSLPNNLPRQATPLIGREKQTAEVLALLRRPDVSLVTLTGPAGTGKTRLSLQIGTQLLDEYKDGVWFVELAALSPEDHRLVPATIAEALGVKEAPGQAITDTLIDYLKYMQMLLVLDNFEQVTPAASQVSSLLKAAPGLKVLVSSRIALKIYGEREYRVPPLSLPDRKLLYRRVGSAQPVVGSRPQAPQQAQVEQYTRCEAVRLFVDRCQAVKADFEITADNAPDIASICTHLDGLPLAIELAAARIRLFTPQALLGRLSDRLKILTGGARDLPARQQTMRGAIEWSYDLLSDEEKQLFRRLAVFKGGRTLEAIESVCDSENLPNEGRLQVDVLEGVQSLLDKSLLVEREGSDRQPRYWMLETIQEYASEKLRESGEEEVLAREHALYYMRMAEEAEPRLVGSEQAQWLNRLEDEHDNLRLALRWARQPGGAGGLGAAEDTGATNRVEVGLRIAAGIWRLWVTRGYYSEGRDELEGLLSLLPSLPPMSPTGRDSVLAARYSWRATAHNAVGTLAYRQGDYVATHTALEQGIAIARELGDKPSMARSYNTLGNVAYQQGDYSTARSNYKQSLALYREVEDKRGIANELTNLGNVAVSQGDYSAARSLYEPSQALYRELGDKRGLASGITSLGDVAFAQGDYATARSLNEQGLALYQELGDKGGTAFALNALGGTSYMQGDYSTAGSLYEQSLALFREIEDKLGIAVSLADLGGVAYMQGDYPRAHALYDQGQALFQELGHKRGMALTLNALGRMAYMQGDYPAATSMYRQGLALSREMEEKRHIAASLTGLGAIAAGVGAERGKDGPDKGDGVEVARQGTRLLGASEALLESIGAVLDPVDRSPYEEGVASARLQLGDEPFERARHEGRAMSTEEAIEYALRFPEQMFAGAPKEYPAHEPAGAERHVARAERQRRVDELHIEVNQAKKVQQVEAIIGTDYFRELQVRAGALLLERKEREAGSRRQQ
jgi:predicted ATPase/class 3 adenylate cyclase